MLSAAENERLTRIGPGTPMGELFRRYWLPALLAEEVSERDGAAVSVPGASAVTSATEGKTASASAQKLSNSA